jgi:hypothetical protein
MVQELALTTKKSQTRAMASGSVINMTLNNLVQSVRFTGGIGVVGVFIPQDPGSPALLYLAQKYFYYI